MKNAYFEDIAQWMTENNIALTKLDDAKFTWIFKKLNKQDTLSSRFIAQHYVPNLFNLTIEKIREEIGENAIYLIADETSDKLNRYVLDPGPVIWPYFWTERFPDNGLLSLIITRKV